MIFTRSSERMNGMKMVIVHFFHVIKDIYRHIKNISIKYKKKIFLCMP